MKNNDILSWDEYFMALAYISAKRSKDPNTQVGACIVKDKKILSLGYNGAPNGYSDDEFPWEREGKFLNTKYAFVVHAEENAIINYYGNKKDLVGASIYVTEFPCNECAKALVQTGIKEVIYLSDKYHDTDMSIASRQILDKCGVKYSQINFLKDAKIEFI